MANSRLISSFIAPVGSASTHWAWETQLWLLLKLHVTSCEAQARPKDHHGKTEVGRELWGVKTFACSRSNISARSGCSRLTPSRVLWCLQVLTLDSLSKPTTLRPAPPPWGWCACGLGFPTPKCCWWLSLLLCPGATFHTQNWWIWLLLPRQPRDPGVVQPRRWNMQKHLKKPSEDLLLMGSASYQPVWISNSSPIKQFCWAGFLAGVSRYFCFCFSGAEQPLVRPIWWTAGQLLLQLA